MEKSTKSLHQLDLQLLPMKLTFEIKEVNLDEPLATAKGRADTAPLGLDRWLIEWQIIKM